MVTFQRNVWTMWESIVLYRFVTYCLRLYFNIFIIVLVVSVARHASLIVVKCAT